jgi:PLP dependent protein
MTHNQSFDEIQDFLGKNNVKLIAVSKTKPIESILQIYKKGIRRFGENKVQELIKKAPLLPEDIEWHMIGHLQTNKVKYIAPFVGLIHSVDRFKLLKEINKQAAKHNRVIPCLLQFHIAMESTKFGFDNAEAFEMLNSEGFKSLKHISIQGVMGMATLTDDVEKIRNEFHGLHQIFDKLKAKYFKDNPDFREISMGMSGDYRIAVEEGSTMVRLGTLIFGERS